MKVRQFALGWVLACLMYALAAGAETIEEKFPDGKTKLKYVVDDDKKKAGAFAEFHENGKQKIKAAYKADELEGAYTEFHENGKIRLSATYKGGKLTGTYTENTEKGVKKMTAVYKDGMLNGALTQYEKGKPVFSQPFKNGEPFFGRTVEQMKKKLADIEADPKKAEGDAAEREAALRRLKAYRYICDVPFENMALDAEMNKAADAGSKLCETIKRLDHTPANPGLPEAEYKLGYKGTSNSNLAMGLKDLPRAVDAWMDDSDAGNIDRIGHRRWCINPAMQKTGFGRAGAYMAMWSFDRSQKIVPDYQFVAYPARGLMPVEYFGPKYAWNVSLNPAKYKIADKAAVRASIHEVDEFLNKTTALKMDYTNVELSGFGISNCVIFRPAAFELKAGQRYLVEVEGAALINNFPAPPIRYIVEFVSVK